MSINKMQASALAEGFLDDIGDEKKGLRPKETFTELFLIAGEFVLDAQKNLVASGNVASGALSQSIVVNEPSESNGIVSMEVLMNFYGQFINKGVKGTKSGSSKGGYSFKNEFPSKKMVKALSGYIGRSRKGTRTVKRGYGPHEVEQKSISQIDSAYALARSIKMLGIKPTGFIDKAVITTRQKVVDRLGKALRIDIINSL